LFSNSPIGVSDDRTLRHTQRRLSRLSVAALPEDFAVGHHDLPAGFFWFRAIQPAMAQQLRRADQQVVPAHQVVRQSRGGTPEVLPPASPPVLEEIVHPFLSLVRHQTQQLRHRGLADNIVAALILPDAVAGQVAAGEGNPVPDWETL
jgi:hypothetical protein